MSNNGKVPLVLFSGGLDSSYLLHELLKESDVEVLYVKAGQCQVKQAKELAQRRRIVELLQELTGNYVLNWHEVNIGQLFNHMPDHSWQQPAMWLAGALNHSTGRRHSKLVVGYVSGDGIVARLHNIERAWYHLQQFSKHDPIPVEFPLSTTSKLSILDRIHPLLWPLVWVCELPKEADVDGSGKREIVACGHCVPCLTMHGTQAMFERAKGQSHKAWADERFQRANTGRDAEGSMLGPSTPRSLLQTKRFLNQGAWLPASGQSEPELVESPGPVDFIETGEPPLIKSEKA